MSSKQPQSLALAEIKRLALDCREIAEYDLDQLSEDRRVQVRESSHYAPSETTTRFAVQMSETRFPPIVVTSDHWTVDGTTRVAARRVRKERFAPAIVLDIAYETATAEQQAELVALAATLNQTNGLPLTKSEVRDVASQLAKLGWKIEEIGRAIGVTPSTVAAVKREIAAREKLGRVGITPNGELRGASFAALGVEHVVDLNDEPYRQLATLAADAGLNASEINSAAKELRAAGSDVGAMDAVRRLREEMAPRIKDKTLTGKSRPPVARQLRQHLGFVVKYAGRELELIETNPAVQADHIVMIDVALGVLQKARSMQEGVGVGAEG